MAQRDLKVTLIGDDKTGKAFGSAGKNADGFGSKIGGLGKGVALAFGGAAVAGIAGLGVAMFQGAKDAASYEQITDQLAQTLKSTGGAAGTSVEALKTYAGQLESISGVDEELILSSQNVLATFTNIKNTVGEGNDVFNQASEAALNLSTTMGGDLQGASVLVGKALNDPIKGMSALSKAGVQLTQAQKDSVKAMVAAGDAAGAQKIILGELETQFGGAAAAAGQGLTGSLARAKDAFSDIFREVATRVLPALASAADWAAAKLPVAFATVKTFIKTKLVPVFESIAAFWSTNGPAILAAIQGMAAGAIEAFESVGKAVMTTVDFFRKHDGAARALGAVVAAVAAGVAAAWVAQAAVSTINAAKSVLAWFTTAAASTTSSTIQSKSTAQIVVGWAAHAASSVASAAKVVASWVLMGAQALLGAAKMAAAWLIALGPIALVIAAVVGLVVIVVKNWDTIRAKTVELWNAVKAATSAAWESVKGTVSGAVSAVVGAVSGAWNSVKSATTGAWDAVRGAVAAGVGAAVGVVSGIPGRVTGALGNLGGLLLNAGRSIVDGLIRGITDRFGALARKASELAQKVKDFLPFSPAKEGPFSGRGNPYYSGRSIANMLADGLVDGKGAVAGAMGTLTDVGDVAGMRLGGTGFVNGRLAATAANAPTESRVTNYNLTVNGNLDGPLTETDLQNMLRRMEMLRG